MNTLPPLPAFRAPRKAADAHVPSVRVLARELLKTQKELIGTQEELAQERAKVRALAGRIDVLALAIAEMEGHGR